MSSNETAKETIRKLEERVEELEKLCQEARESQLAIERWAALGRVAGVLAHRISNKAGMIRLCVRDLYESIDPKDEWARRNLETIERDNQYLLVVAKQLLRPVSASSEKLEPSDINLLLKEAVNRANIPSDVEPVFRCADDLPAVPANKWVVEAFVELLSNAVQAMADSLPRVLEIGSRRSEDNGIEVWFTDTGCGIQPQARERIFELFYTGRSDKESENATSAHLGFGLWWVKTFITELGGEINFESRVGKGTTFVVHLPCSMRR
jgi:two-component system NtrC family sensor kinase